MNESMTIKQFAEQAGIAPSALRYYEREGLMPAVHRNASGHRTYGELHARWARFLTRLRATRMPIRDVRLYVEALGCGPAGDQDRMDLLAAHRDRIREDIARLEDCLSIVERKLELGCRPLDADG